MNPCRALCNNFSFFAACLLFSSTAIAQDPAKQPVSADLLVKGATIVTMDSNRRVLENGFLAIRGDEIPHFQKVSPPGKPSTPLAS